MIDYTLINGVDIVDILRIEKILEGKRDLFLNKVFTEIEISTIKSKGYRSENIAGLFASKEAISKAIGTGIGRVSFKDMQITYDSFGKPIVNISEEVRKRFGILQLSLSISHEKRYAIAFVTGFQRK